MAVLFPVAATGRTPLGWTLTSKAPRQRLRTFAAALSAVVVFSFALTLDLFLGQILIPRDETSFRRPDRFYHHDLVPNWRGEANWGPIRYRMRTNSLGFRDRDVREVPLKDTGKRVVLMGDSFVEGLGVNFEDTFAGRLATRGAEIGIQVLNAGVIGFSPKLHARKLRYLIETVGLRFDTLFVFIDNSDPPNEIVYKTYEGGRESWTAWLWREAKRRSYALYRFTGQQNASLRVQWNASGMPFADDLDNRPFEDPLFFGHGRWTEHYKYAEEGLALCAAHMGEIVELCRVNGIALTIIVYPWQKNIEMGDIDHIMVRYWRRFSEQHGAGFVELYSAFVEIGSRQVLGAQDFFIPGDMHWNERGHAVVADFLWPHISKNTKAVPKHP